MYDFDFAYVTFVWLGASTTHLVQGLHNLKSGAGPDRDLWNGQTCQCSNALARRIWTFD